MKKYHIENIGCDDTTEYDILLNDVELKLIIEVFESNNKVASYQCKPKLYIWEFMDGYYYYETRKALNKGYEELNKKEGE